VETMAWHRPTDRPFTVAVCTDCAGEQRSSLIESLREVIRRCSHGALVLSECVFGDLHCDLRWSRSGVVVMMQACTTDRVPRGPMLAIGPIACPDDVEAVCEWLERGRWDYRALPERLRPPAGSASCRRYP
jgi:hypothetical protein